MSSATAPHTPKPRTSSKRTLQRLRLEAGYRSGRALAAALGIPASTYARYERAPEGPDCGIPLANAWAIADALGCTIDAVVGREDIDAPHEPTLDERAAALGREGQRMLYDYLGFLESREAAEAAQREEAR